ncbi:four-carbon acid sugar kinase family protein [Nesterenkonia aurantiaca]|uniref:four-carbon acid sugar kinase family protein n=1 Tax=Nesterenkonia aurantiaca TaxID=1436010 RepID=UPI003EE5B104
MTRIPHSDIRSPITAALIADDLTGANDSVVAFARQGWDTRLMLAEAPNGIGLPEADCAYATTTDVRATSDHEAFVTTRSAILQARTAGAAHLYLKIDSTIRGTFAAQIRGAAAALREEQIMMVVCPAYPSMGRTVESSLLLVDGVPVADTALRDDPATPVTRSNLCELVPGSTVLRPSYSTTNAYKEALEAAYASQERTVIVDASTDDDLEALAAALAEVKIPTLPVGSAGLASALSRAWAHRESTTMVTSAPPAGTEMLIQVSSLNPVSLAQLQYAQSHLPAEVTLLEPALENLQTPDDARQWAQQHVNRQTGGITILRTPQERTNDPRTIAAHLGAAFAALVRQQSPSALGFIGGDGAFAALRALDCTTLQILDSLTEGVPLAVAVDGDISGSLVFTKAGGFGTNDSLTHSISAMRDALNRSTS